MLLSTEHHLLDGIAVTHENPSRPDRRAVTLEDVSHTRICLGTSVCRSSGHGDATTSTDNAMVVPDSMTVGTAAAAANGLHEQPTLPREVTAAVS